MIDNRIQPREQLSNTGLAIVVCCVAVMAFDWCVPSALAFADLPQIRRVLVDAESPEKWLNENLQPIMVHDLESLVNEIQPTTSPDQLRQIDTAVYTATFVESAAAFRDGKFVATIRGRNTSHATVHLDPLQIPVSNLRWKDNDVAPVWGTVDNRRILRITGNAEAELLGDWTLQGRRINDDVEFSLSLAPATISLIELWLPPNLSLRSSEGSVVGPIDVNQLGMHKWRVEIGAQHQCLLVITKSDQSRLATPRVVYAQDTASLIRVFGGQLTIGVTLNVYRAPIQELTFTVSEAINIQSVSYGSESGQSVPLSWKETAVESDDSRHLTVILPDPVLGPSRRIQIQSTFSPSSERPDVLPKVALNDAVFSTGEYQLQVESPLEIRSFNTFGMRQSEPLDVSPAAETLRFQQVHPNAHLAVDIGRPKLSLSASVRTHLDTRAKDWLLVSQIDWRNRSGSTYAVRCQIPHEWRVTDVASQEESVGNEISNWWVKRFDDRAEIIVEFKNALTPTQPAALQISARRKVTDDTLAVDVPVLQPLGCSEVNSLHAIAYPTTDSPIWNDVQGIEQTDEAAWLSHSPNSITNEQPSLPDLDDESPHFLFLRSTTGNTTAPLEFRSSRNTFAAEASVGIQIAGATVTEIFELHGTPSISRLRQIFVYVTSHGPPLDWKLRSDDVSSIAATKLLSTRHADWNLPETGELWEIRFSTATSAPFDLYASRTRSIAADDSQSLLYVPRAESFQGNISLAADIPNPQISTKFLTPSRVPRRRRLETKPLQNRVHWTYDSPEGLLIVSNSDSNSREPATTSVTALVRVTFNSDRTGRDFYRVRYDFTEPNAPTDFAFRLDRSASLISVQFDGVPVIAAEKDQQFVVPVAGTSPPESVEIEYSIKSATGLIQDERPIVTPDVSHSVLRTNWQFVLSPQWEVQSLSDEFYRIDSLRHVSWPTRLLGPLGRRSTDSIFNPIKWECWSTLLRIPREGDRALDIQSQQQDEPFEDWQLTRAITAGMPKSTTIVLFNTTRSTALSWACLLGVFISGLLLRLIPWKRRRFSVYFLAVCAVSTSFSPPALAEILGGCLLGAVLAILWPQQLLNRLGLWNTSTQPSVANVASSVTRVSTIGPALVLVGLWTASAMAQQELPNGTSPNANTNGQSTVEMFDLFVPIDRNLRPVSGVVYASSDLIKKLNELRRDTVQPVRYVIQSAVYEGDIHSSFSSVSVTARYEIVVLPGESAVTVPLSLGPTNPFACSINGEPASIRRGTSESYLIDLPAVASETETQRFVVIVSIRPDIQFSAGAGALQMEIPPVLDSRVVFTFPEGVATIDFPGARGEVQVASTRASAMLGPVRNLQAVWYREPQQQSLAKADANVACVVEAFPTRLHYRYRVNVQITEGVVDFLEWRLPKETIVTQCNGSVVSQWSNRAGQDDRTTLLINLVSPQHDAFSLDIELIHPNTVPSDYLVVPALLPSSDDDSATVINLRSYQVGVSPTPGYQIEFINPASRAVNNISIEEFLQVWQEVETLRPPRLAFDVQSPLEPLQFRFMELSTVRTVQMSQLCEVEPNRINWTLSANIAISKSGAPAFRHTLDLDPRLTLESVSVEENDAERLLRWSRQGSRIDLYLKDKTSGIQNLTIVATLPTANQRDIILPETRFHDVDLVESELRLIAPVSAIEAFSYQQQRQSLTNDASRELDDGRSVLLDRFPLDPGSPAAILHTANVDTECDSIVVVDRLSRDRARITQFWAFPAETSNRTRARLQLPEQFAQKTEFKDQDAVLSAITGADGMTVFDVAPSATPSATRIVEFSTDVPIPSSGEWDVPIATCLSHAPALSQLVVRPKDSMIPRSPETVPETTSTLPAWFAKASEGYPLSTESGVYDATPEIANGSSPGFLVASLVDESIATIADTCVWLSKNGVDLGSTTFIMVTPPNDPIQISIPERQRVRDVIVNGVQIPVEFSEDNIITVSPTTDSPIQAVSIHWTHVGHPRSATVSQFQYQLPTLHNVTVEQSLVTILPPEDFVIAFGNKEVMISVNESLLNMLEGLFEANRHAFESSRQVSTFGWELLKTFQLSVQDSFSETAVAGIDGQYRLRFEDISNRIDQLQKSSGETVFLSDEGSGSKFAQPAVSLRLPLPENGVSARFENESGRSLPIQMWALNSKLPMVALFTLSLFVAIVIFRFLSRIDLSRSMANHPHFSALLLCIIWWGLFRFSVFGLLGITIVLGLILRRLTRQRTDRIAPINL